MFVNLTTYQKIIVKGIIIVMSILMLSGCQASDYTEEGVLANIERYYKDFKSSEDYKKFKEAWNIVKQVKILVAKMNQNTILRAVKYDYLLNERLPSNKQELEELIDKTLDEMRLDASFNFGKTIDIFSTDPELTKEDVPDLLIDPNNF